MSRLKRKNYLEPLPPGAVLVAKPSKFGNPFKIGRDGDRRKVLLKYGLWLKRNPALIEAAKRELKGKDLVCYCPLDQPCHADILLRIANEP